MEDLPSSRFYIYRNILVLWQLHVVNYLIGGLIASLYLVLFPEILRAPQFQEGTLSRNYSVIIRRIFSRGTTIFAFIPPHYHTSKYGRFPMREG